MDATIVDTKRTVTREIAPCSCGAPRLMVFIPRGALSSDGTKGITKNISAVICLRCDTVPQEVLA